MLLNDLISFFNFLHYNNIIDLHQHLSLRKVNICEVLIFSEQLKCKKKSAGKHTKLFFFSFENVKLCSHMSFFKKEMLSDITQIIFQMTWFLT